METNDFLLYGAIGVVGYFAYQAYQNSQAAIAAPAPIYVTIPNPVNNTTATIPVSSNAPVATSNGTVTPIVQPPATIPLASMPVASNAATSTVVTTTSAPATITYIPLISLKAQVTQYGTQVNGTITNAPPNTAIFMPYNGNQFQVGTTDSNGNAGFAIGSVPTNGDIWTIGSYKIAVVVN